MSSHIALPREGHLEQVFHIFLYMKKYHSTKMIFYPSDPVMNKVDFQKQDWALNEFSHMKDEFTPVNIP